MFSRKTIANDRASTDRLPCSVFEHGVHSSLNAVGFMLRWATFGSLPGSISVSNPLDKERNNASPKRASSPKKFNGTKKVWILPEEKSTALGT